jgi:hypothetical protein
LFSVEGRSLFVHETGHTLGLPDLYQVNIVPANNKVNGAEYKPFIADIMASIPGILSEYDIKMINAAQASFPIPHNKWVDYQPSQNIVKITTTNNDPISNAAVKIYISDPTNYTGGVIDTIPDFSGVTNENGEFNMGSKILGSSGLLSVRAFLVEVTKDQTKKYFWFNFTDVNLKYLSGEKTRAVYTFAF